MDSIDITAGVVMIAILIIAVVGGYYLIRKQEPVPTSASPASISFWVVPDSSTVNTSITCPAGTTIAVQDADYGAPWSQCAWSDVSTQSGTLMNGKNTYSIPASTNLITLLGVTDPCSGTNKIYAGSYACQSN